MSPEQGSLYRLTAYVDGGARGNPGPAGFGVRIEQPDGTLVEEFSEAIGHATNNVAEYRGLLANEIGRVTFEHVGRAHNAHADRLANAAMDRTKK